MKTPLIFFALQTLSLWMEAKGLDLGSMIPLCSAKDPNLNDCVKTSGQKLIPFLKNGIPDLNLPGLDPMTTPSVNFDANTRDMDISITYNNVVQAGFATVIIESADVDLEKKSMLFKLTYPFFTFTGDYVLKNGRIFDFQIEGNGKANISVWDCTSLFTLKYHVENDRVIQDSFDITYTLNKIYLDYSNLVINNDEELSASAAKFINENSAEIIDAFKPQLTKFYRDMNGAILKTFLEAVPYSSLFKDL